ncbi:hypothetical protein Tco_0146330 [Tanacetum coccineum]
MRGIGTQNIKSQVLCNSKGTTEYVLNPNKEATMKITRGDNPLNLIVHPNFRLRTMGFSEWLEVHALASKKSRKSNDMLLQSLRAKFQWVINQAKKLGLSPPPALATFGMTEPGSSLGIKGRQGLVIREPVSGIFFYNGNWDLVFQREEEFHLATTAQLIRLQRSIQRGTPKADEMFRKLELTIKARDDAVQARDIGEIVGPIQCPMIAAKIYTKIRLSIEEPLSGGLRVEDYLKTYSSAVMDISWRETQYLLEGRQKGFWGLFLKLDEILKGYYFGEGGGLVLAGIGGWWEAILEGVGVGVVGWLRTVWILSSGKARVPESKKERRVSLAPGVIPGPSSGVRVKIGEAELVLAFVSGGDVACRHSSANPGMEKSS